MQLNCKQGDIAVVVGGLLGLNLGKICTCLELVQGSPSFIKYDGNRGSLCEGNWWRTDVSMKLCSPAKVVLGECYYILDDIVKPLRDSGGEDETFEWAGKPQELCKEK